MNNHLKLRGQSDPTGLEPATSAVTGRRANQLRYGALLESTEVNSISSNSALQIVRFASTSTGFEPVLPP